MASKLPSSLGSVPQARSQPVPGSRAATGSDDEFLAQLSHQLRGHLGSIANWLHLLMSGSLTPQLQREGLEAIDHALKAQTRIVDELDARLAANRKETAE